MVILVDTDVIIDYLRASEKQSTFYYNLFIDEKNNAALSFVTVIELMAGQEIKKAEKRKVVEEIIDRSQVLGGSKEFYYLAGEILRTHLTKFQDGLIAAHAILYSLPLLTRNKKDFERIKGVKLFSQ